jgi:pimeloyl-ACP methyl ester carboxylesterase
MTVVFAPNGRLASLMSFPAGLHVVEDDAESVDASSVVLVHGSLDRAESFRRTTRRLSDVNTLSYDRRGYQRSREAAHGVELGLEVHIDDLVRILEELRQERTSRLTAVGHSYGGDVVIGAALRRPDLVDAIGAFEPPMPWLGFRRPGTTQGWAPMPEDAGDNAQAFFIRMVGPGAWERLPQEGRHSRRADGPALVADLVSMRGQAPFDATKLSVPSVFGMGGTESQPHHRATVTWLADHVPNAELFEIPASMHGAHLSHPDSFAAFVKRVTDRADEAQETFAV